MITNRDPNTPLSTETKTPLSHSTRKTLATTALIARLTRSKLNAPLNKRQESFKRSSRTTTMTLSSYMEDLNFLDFLDLTNEHFLTLGESPEKDLIQHLAMFYPGRIENHISNDEEIISTETVKLLLNALLTYYQHPSNNFPKLTFTIELDTLAKQKLRSICDTLKKALHTKYSGFHHTLKDLLNFCFDDLETYLEEEPCASLLPPSGSSDSLNSSSEIGSAFSDLSDSDSDDEKPSLYGYYFTRSRTPSAEETTPSQTSLIQPPSARK
jgi:hypothetical protein